MRAKECGGKSVDLEGERVLAPRGGGGGTLLGGSNQFGKEVCLKLPRHINFLHAH